jgi:hypothetical protein
MKLVLARDLHLPDDYTPYLSDHVLPITEMSAPADKLSIVQTFQQSKTSGLVL